MTGNRLTRTAYLGLGGNQGERIEHLSAGLSALDADPLVRVDRISRVYETEYVGSGSQDPYLNACAGIHTSLEPGDLMALLQRIELSRGRQPDSHMQPRPLDLDILLYEGLVQADPVLTVPHPRLRERAFVLEPLAEIAGHEIFPDSGETVAEACAKIRRNGCAGVSVWPEIIVWSRSLSG